MSHCVVVLEDQKRAGEATSEVIGLWDPDAAVEVVRSVREAQKVLSQRLHDTAYVIVDLLIEPSPADEQGDALVQWILENRSLRNVPVLILSSFPAMIRQLSPRIKQTVPYVSRTSDLSTIFEQLRPFIERARARFASGQEPAAP